jgi:hypothetical protein
MTLTWNAFFTHRPNGCTKMSALMTLTYLIPSDKARSITSIPESGPLPPLMIFPHEGVLGLILQAHLPLLPYKGAIPRYKLNQTVPLHEGAMPAPRQRHSNSQPFMRALYLIQSWTLLPWTVQQSNRSINE